MIWKQFTHLGNFPPELKARFNSFLTTEFDDSLSVEMQLRSIIKWCQDNFTTVDTLIDFINDISNWLKQFETDFGTKLEERVISVLSEWQASGQLDVVISEALQWELDNYIATNEQDKLSLTEQLTQIVLNVKTYGAVGDGITDDTSAIQSAVDNIESGDTLFFPKGTYLVTQSVVFPTLLKGIYVTGNGTIKIGLGLTTNVFDINQVEGIRVEGIAINANRSSIPSSIPPIFAIKNSKNISFKTVSLVDGHVLETTNKAIRLVSANDCSNVSLENVTCQKSDLLTSYNSTGIRVIGCQFGTDYSPSAKNCINPIYLDGCTDVVVANTTTVGATLHDGTGTGHPTGGLLYTINSSNITILGNVVKNASEHALYIMDGSDIVVEGNTLNADVNFRNIKKGKIVGNLIQLPLNPTYSINLSNPAGTDETVCEDILIANNTMFTRLGAVFLSGFENVKIDNNTIKGDRATFIRFLTGMTAKTKNLYITNNSVVTNDNQLECVSITKHITGTFVMKDNNLTRVHSGLKTFGDFYLNDSFSHYHISGNNVNGVTMKSEVNMTDGWVVPLTYTVNKGELTDPDSGVIVSDVITSISSINGVFVLSGVLYEIKNLYVDFTTGVQFGGIQNYFISIQRGGGISIAYAPRPSDLMLLRLLNYDDGTKKTKLIKDVDTTSQYKVNIPQSGTLLATPNGTKYKLTINEGGTLVTTTI